MILHGPDEIHIPSGEPITLDDLFRASVARRPDAPALSDPPNRPDFTDGLPRRLTYAQADHIVSAIAGRLRRLGLSTDAAIALQLPNSVESVLTLLAVLRAGMIAVPMPLLWRRSEAAAALNRIGAKAFITCARVGAIRHCAIARDTASEVFPVRYVCSFGEDLPDGVIPFDDLMSGAPLLEATKPVARDINPAAHTSVVTFETTAEGPVAVARNHAQLIAGAQAIASEAQLRDGAAILATCGGSSFAGLAAGLLSWLVTGGTLSLHHPFDQAAFSAQCAADACDTVVLPGAMTQRFAQAGLLAHAGLRSIVGVWRTPERLPVGSPWQHPDAGLTDVLSFGETGLIAGRRGAAGLPLEIPLGSVTAPRDTSVGEVVLETAVTEAGTLALRGPMVPSQPYPPGAERLRAKCFVTDARGFADTGYPCRADRDNGELSVGGPPPGMIGVGGYRFMPEPLHALVGGAAPDALIAALPDALSGHRLAGSAVDRAALRQVLRERGANPLIVGAFAERRRTAAA
jgi:non-ribosomal peptide synthetase component E (peptide arylation enzyme)